MLYMNLHLVDTIPPMSGNTAGQTASRIAEHQNKARL